MKNFKHRKTILLILSVVTTTGVFIFAPDVNAAPNPALPVPSYDSVVSTADTTTITVPANLSTEWKGTYTRKVNSTLTLSDITLREYITLVIAREFPFESTATRTYKFNPAAIYKWTAELAQKVNSTTAEPNIKIVNNRVTSFTPPQTGKSLDRYHSTLKIIDSLQQGQSTVTLTVHTTEPRNSLESMNDLGIKELIGRGESKFNGSPYNRRHNIKIGIQKMAGIIVKPGEEFSFNEYLGPVEASTGFLPELVIRADKGTVPEFGGGLCQVSSTAWRAAMHAGLPITQRRNHSYAVQYYAPQGTDATIYPGVVDVKFTNDTGHNILIWPYYKNADYIVFDFYGTFDGRKVELGTPYQYDKKSDGSLKASWSRTVTRNGVPKKETFNSVYKPPALFHKKEEFASNPQSPSPTPSVPVPSTPPPATPPATSPTPSSTL